MSTDLLKDDAPLRAVVDAAHDRAFAAVEDDEHDALDAVACCSAHLAAVDCVLYPAAQRHVRDGRRRLRNARLVDHALQQALCRLDRRLTGDVHRADVPVAALVQQVQERLRVHVEAEHRLIESLRVVLDEDQQQQLAASLRAATIEAPSRPHPHLRHTPLASLITRVEAGVDRVRDVMDNRVVASARPAPARRPSGRWSCYLMGLPYPEDEHVPR